MAETKSEPLCAHCHKVKREHYGEGAICGMGWGLRDTSFQPEAAASVPQIDQDRLCEHCGRSVQMQARRLMLEHYDSDLYKRALEEHMNVCTRPMLIQMPAASAGEPDQTFMSAEEFWPIWYKENLCSPNNQVKPKPLVSSGLCPQFAEAYHRAAMEHNNGNV